MEIRKFLHPDLDENHIKFSINENFVPGNYSI